MKILLADDHALFREGIRLVLAQLAPDVEIIEAGSRAAILEQAAAHDDLGLLLLDLDLGGEDGFGALELLSRRYPMLPVVVLSASDRRADMQRALAGGAMGFIPKSATVPVMLGALRLVMAGGVYVPPALVAGDAAAGPAPNGIKLTPRQRDVLELLIAGKSNKAIAAELGLTVATVKAHVTAAFKALNVASRTQAMLAADRLGIGPTPTRS